jgi:hypothetical protein
MALDRQPWRSRLDPNEFALYVRYVQTAPWNETWLPGFRKLGLVGYHLIQEAVRIANDEGVAGRIGLHSLPLATRFYERLGLLNCGNDRDYEDLPYLELPAAKTTNDTVKETS